MGKVPSGVGHQRDVGFYSWALAKLPGTKVTLIDASHRKHWPIVRFTSGPEQDIRSHRISVVVV